MTRAERLQGGVEKAEAAMREVEGRRDALAAERSVVDADIATARDALQRCYGRRASIQARLEFYEDEILEAARQLNEARGEVFNAARDMVRKSLDAQPAVARPRSDDPRVRVVRGPVSLPSGRAEVVVEADANTHFSVGDWYDEWEILEIARSGNNERRLRLMLRCAKCNARCTCGRVDELARKEV